MSRSLVVFAWSVGMFAGGCIFGLSPEGDGDSDREVGPAETDVPDAVDTVDASDAERRPEAGDTHSDLAETGETDTSGAGDADADADGSTLPCSEPRRASGITGGPALLRGRPRLIYVTDEGENLGVLFSRENSTETLEIDVSGEEIRAIGPSLHYDEDRRREIPYVVEKDLSGDPVHRLKLVEIRRIAADPEPLDNEVRLPKSYSRLAVGDFDDDCNPDVFWPDTLSDDGSGSTGPVIQRVDQDSSPAIVERPRSGAWALLGSFDANPRDGNEELYWYSTNSGGRYIADDAKASADTEEDLSIVGENNGSVGVGGPRIFSVGGGTEFPVVDGSNKPYLFTAGSKNFRQVEVGEDAAKSPISSADVDGDRQFEIVFLKKDGKVFHADPVGDSAEKLRISGEDLEAKTATGVVAGSSRFFRRIDQK